MIKNLVKWLQKTLHLSILDLKLVKFILSFTVSFSVILGYGEYSVLSTLRETYSSPTMASIIVTNFVLYTFYSIFMFVFFKKEVSKPLRKMTRFLLLSSHPELEYKKLVIANNKETVNELDICTSAINTMNSNLYQSSLSLKRHQEELEQKIKEKTKKLREASEERRMLISILCHDMSNFLTVIDLTTKLIKENEDTDSKTKSYYIKRMEKSTRAIMEVLKNVKDMEAIALGVKNLNLKHIKLTESISDMLFFFRDQLEVKQLQIKLENLLEEDDLVIAEPTSLSHQVLSNIMSNAIKFSEKNSLITIKLIKTKKHSIRVTIKDSGIGIPEKDIGNIFRLEKHSSRSGTLGEAGTGFGIPIAKTFVEKFGGEISVESKCKEDFPYDHGSSFHIDLRRAA